MAMLTDDEYKDFEAQIKLQEKVFLAFSRIFQKFSAVYWLVPIFDVLMWSSLILLTFGKARIR